MTLNYTAIVYIKPLHFKFGVHRECEQSLINSRGVSLLGRQLFHLFLTKD